MDIQNGCVAIVIAAAVGYVVRQAWKTMFVRATSGCGAGCGSCASANANKNSQGFVPLADLAAYHEPPLTPSSGSTQE